MATAPNVKQDKVRVNEQISAPSVRLIGADGEQIGIVPVAQAMDLAAQSSLDLVEVASQATPPVCRIMDYAKFKYQQAKKAQEARKKQTHTLVKEVKLRPKIEEHDFTFKMKNIIRFLQEHNRVKVTVQFRGREISYADSGRKLLERVANEVAELGVVEGAPKLEGRFMLMVLAPK
ncbi:MAG: translation initiation factor IF-3 [Desulfarculales bacterium]|jgi:translation initiation factor IF-3|nr:translation initiation factor IF-3 [Desulfarculales bacterium]